MCYFLDCGSITAIPENNFKTNVSLGTEYKDKGSLNCIKGYKIVNESNTNISVPIKCTSEGTWDVKDIRCEKKGLHFAYISTLTSFFVRNLNLIKILCT